MREQDINARGWPEKRPPEILTCEQGTPEWLQARAGMPTSSCFSKILARGKKPGEASVMRRKYLCRLAGEILTGEPEETYENQHMIRGREMEGQARATYAFMRGVEPELLGFVYSPETHAGCSPDSLIGDDGVLEIKTALPSILIDKIERSFFPSEHKAQTQGALWVTEREWVDLCIFWPGLPLFISRAKRDETYIKDLASAVAAFNEELAELVERIRRYTGEPKEDLRRALEASAA